MRSPGEMQRTKKKDSKKVKDVQAAKKVVLKPALKVADADFIN